MPQLQDTFTPHLFAIFGYGCHLNTELKKYLDNNVEFANRERPDCLIFCGGFTQRKSAPGVSEARLMRDYVIPRLCYTPKYILLDEDSYTTPDNAQKLAEKATWFLWTLAIRFSVACEATRALKVDDAIRYCMSRRAEIVTTSWELMSPTKQIISTLYDWAAVRFPPLARYFRNKRIRRAEQI